MRHEILVPFQQIAHGGEQAAIPVDILEGHVGVKRAITLDIRGRSALDNARVIVAPRRARHAEWTKQTLLGERGKGVPEGPGGEPHLTRMIDDRARAETAKERQTAPPGVDVPPGPAQQDHLAAGPQRPVHLVGQARQRQGRTLDEVEHEHIDTGAVDRQTGAGRRQEAGAEEGPSRS